MRIIAGTARGRKLLSVPKTKPVKPISDRIKQSLFDIIKPRIPACYMLDLFAGTGAVGLEALSRGAGKVVFVEREPACLRAINRNLEKLGFTEKAIIKKADILAGVGWLGHFSEGEGYDIIFMGPPYRDQNNVMLALSEPVLASVGQSKILAEHGIAIVQHHETEKFAIPENLEVFRTEQYGDTIVTFLRYKKAQ